MFVPNQTRNISPCYADVTTSAIILTHCTTDIDLALYTHPVPPRPVWSCCSYPVWLDFKSTQSTVWRLLYIIA